MRTTLTLDEDVAQEIKKISRSTGTSFKVWLNDLLRFGLKHVKKPPSSRKYRTKARALGLKEGVSLDNIQELLSDIEGEDQR